METDNKRYLISIITSIGAFSVSALSIFLGYKLFILGATGGFHFSSNFMGIKLDLVSIAPGLGFALFGMFISWKALNVLISKRSE